MCWIFDGRVVKHTESEVCLHTCSLTLVKMAHWIDETAINFFFRSVCKELDVWAISFSILGTNNRVSLLYSAQPPIQWVPGAISMGGSGWGVKLTTHLSHIFMVRCLSKHRRNFLFYLRCRWLFVANNWRNSQRNKTSLSGLIQPTFLQNLYRSPPHPNASLLLSTVSENHRQFPRQQIMHKIYNSFP
jgi:hypothetical protein